MDLDGTALPDGKHMPERTIQACERAIAKGAKIIIVTGRSFCFLSQMSFCTYHYAICCNGVKLVEAYTGNTVFADYMTEEEALLALSLLRPYDPFIELSVDNNVMLDEKAYKSYPTRSMPEHNKLYYDTGRLLVVPTLEDYIRSGKGKIEKFTLMRNDGADTSRMREAINQTGLFDTGTGIDVYKTAAESHLDNLAIVPKRANKGKRLLALAESLGISREETLAFGDGPNDISMLKAAGIGVAMGNADDYTKQQADFVTEASKDDGIAIFLETQFGI